MCGCVDASFVIKLTKMFLHIMLKGKAIEKLQPNLLPPTSSCYNGDLLIVILLVVSMFYVHDIIYKQYIIPTSHNRR